jgi:uncharacterized membrane protein
MRAHGGRPNGRAAWLGTTLLAALLAACGGSNHDGMGPTLAIGPAAPTVHVGSTLQLHADGATGPLRWSSSDTLVATVAAGLVTGIAPGTATIRAIDGTRDAITTVTVTLPATIALSTSVVNFGAAKGGVVPTAQTVDVTNAGDDNVDGLALGTIVYSSGASGWLSASVSPATAPASITLQPTTTALTVGTYTATIPLTSTTAVNSPRTITVTYTVGTTPVIALGRTAVTFNVQAGTAVPDSQSVGITNGGGGSLTGLGVGTITYGAGASGWLTAHLSGTTAPATLYIRPSTSALAAGTYTATVPVTSTVPGVVSMSVNVTYHVTAAAPAPSIALAATSVGFQATAGGSIPASQTVDVTNSGGGSLTGLATSVTYSAGQPTGWLAASLDQTTAPATLTVQPSSVLAAGTYTAQVKVTSGVADNSPQTIAVTYVVTPAPVIALSRSTVADTAFQSGVDPADVNVGVSNSGGGSLTGLSTTISYVGSPTGWLSATLASTAPQSPSTTPLTLSVTTGSIAPGSYTARVIVTTSLAGVAPDTVTVTFTRIATLSGDVLPQVFTPNCAFSGCHAAPTVEGVNLSSTDSAYASLVNQSVESVPTATRVVPGDSVNSYLVKQLKAAATNSNDNMPPACATAGTNPCLSSALAHLVAIWIQQGARKTP